jgi:hypothetical protein
VTSHALFVATLACCSLIAVTLVGAPLEPGQTFPDLRLPRLGEDGLHSVSSLTHGKKTLLLVFASW